MDLQLLLPPEVSPNRPTQRTPAASSVRIVQEEVGGFDADPLNYWREVILRNFADVEVRAADRSDFHGRVSARHSEAGRLSLIVAAEQSVQRRYREPRTAYEDVFFVVLMNQGTQAMEQDGRAVLLEPGDIAMYDATRPHRLAFSGEWSEVVLSVPRALLQAQVARTELCTARKLPATSPLGCMLADSIRSWMSQLSRIQEDAMPVLMRHTSALLGLAFAAEGFVPPETKSRLAALERIKSFVEQHLSNPSLGSQFVAEGTGLSPRYINRLFESEGTSLMRYVLEARLARCRLELEDPRFAALGITEVAMRWGFNNLSHFSRTFHERYGMSPSVWRCHGGTAGRAEIALRAAGGMQVGGG